MITISILSSFVLESLNVNKQYELFRLVKVIEWMFGSILCVKGLVSKVSLCGPYSFFGVYIDDKM